MQRYVKFVPTKKYYKVCVSHVSYQESNKGDSRQALNKTNRKACYTVSLDHNDLEILEGSEWLNNKLLMLLSHSSNRNIPMFQVHMKIV